MATFKTPSGRTITWWEIVDDPCSPRLRFEPDRTSAVRVIECAWDDYLDLALGIIGDSHVTTGPAITQDDIDNRLPFVNPYTPTGQPLPGSGYAPTPLPRPFPDVTDGYAFVGRYVPWSFPIRNSSKNDRFLYASSVEIEGRGVPDNSSQIENDGTESKDSIAVYKHARFTIQFDTRMYDIMDDETFIGATQKVVDESLMLRYVTKIYRPQGEFLHLDGNAYFYGGIRPAKALTRGVNKTIISYNLSLTWHFIPAEAVPSTFLNFDAPNLAIDNCLGRINDRDFHGCKKGTLLLMAAEIKPQVSAFGNRTYDITYMFKFLNPSGFDMGGSGNAVGHNHIFRPFAPSGWYEAVSSSALATAVNPTNFIAQTENVNIYNFANFRMLFRPANWR